MRIKPMTMNRRSFLHIGGSLCGLSLVDLLRLEAAGQVASEASETSAIFIFLTGAQSQLDTWDLKPDNKEVGGEFKPISTNVPELQICEHMPKLARQADKYVVLRNIAHTIADHFRGQRYMRTGNRPLPALDYPELGSIVGKELRSPDGIPPYVTVPLLQGSAVRFESAGYLGTAYRSFSVQGDPNDPQFSVRALKAPEGLSPQRRDRRIAFMNRIDQGLRGGPTRSQELEGMDHFYQKAVSMLSSERLRKAFDLSSESDQLRDLYGRHAFGQGCLLARRLVEAGVRYVGLDFNNWDTHRNNFGVLKNQLLPPWDQGLAALLQDLNDRGRLGKTLVWSTGEFGRTPTINNNAGRDHWARSGSVMVAGGGIRGGQVVGKTDAQCAEPVSHRYTPDDLAATFLKIMGVDPHKEYHTPDGRPVLAVRDGKLIPELVEG
jgi:hypothetical protein